MNQCEHTHSLTKAIKEKILGKYFSFRGEVCGDCSAVLWTDATQKAFNHWLFKLHEKEPNLFVIQPRLTSAASKFLDKLHESFKDHSRATLIRAMVYLFIDDLGRDAHFAAEVAKVQQSESYDYFTKGEKNPRRVRVKPSQLLDLIAWSKSTGYAPAKIMEMAVVGMLSLYRENERQKKNQDAQRLTEMIHGILRAA
jgi:hypothetical protein